MHPTPPPLHPQVLAQVEEELELEQELSYRSSTLCRDALALSMGAGGDAGSLHLRGSFLYTCQMPGTPCKHPDCIQPSCSGNSVQFSGEASTSRSRASGFKLLWPHHKNSHRGIPGTTIFISPTSTTAKLLEIYMGHAR